MLKNSKLTGQKKEQQVKYLHEMDINLKEKKQGWEDRNTELSKKIEALFKD